MKLVGENIEILYIYVQHGFHIIACKTSDEKVDNNINYCFNFIQYKRKRYTFFYR